MYKEQIDWTKQLKCPICKQETNGSEYKQFESDCDICGIEHEHCVCPKCANLFDFTHDLEQFHKFNPHAIIEEKIN